MTEVTHFMRRPHLAAYSIERLYDDIRHNLSCDITVNVRVNKHFSSGLLYRVFDMIQARHHQNDVNHVTGDVHYLTYFLDKNKTILTIHDCEMLARSKGLKRFFLWLFWFWIPEKRVSWIVVVSEETKKQLKAKEKQNLKQEKKKDALSKDLRTQEEQSQKEIARLRKIFDDKLKKNQEDFEKQLFRITQEKINFKVILLFKILVKLVINLVCFLTHNKKNQIVIELKLYIKM